MPELYIGNMSKQIQQFCYRSTARPGVIVQTIPIGGQIRISPNGRDINLSPEEIDHILGQHRGYGIIDIKDIDQLDSPFNSVCFSIGAPITPENLHRAMVRKEELVNKFGSKVREEAAVAVNQQIEEHSGPLKALEMSFTEEEPRGGYADNLDHLAEGVRVTRDANVAPLRGRR
jgi:hypothetical protein